VTVTEYLGGIAYITLIFCSAGICGYLLRRRFLAGWEGAPAWLAELIFGVSLLVVAALLLGSLGQLTAAALLISIMVLTVATWAWLRGPEGADTGNPPPAPPPRPLATWLAIAVAFLTILHLSGGVRDSLDFGIYPQDSTWYHLPFAASIFQSGETWALRFTDPMALTAWFYPQDSELVHAVGMLAFGNDSLSPLLNLVWTGLTLLAAWCIGRPYGRGPETLVVAAIVVDAGMMEAQAGNAPNDVASLCFLLAAIALLTNGWEGRRGGGRWRPAPGLLFAAGLGAGLAIGTKMTLLVAVAMLTVVILVLVAPDRRHRSAAIWLGGIGLTGGYWYLRNLAHAGNPLPWISLGPLPGPDQVALYPRPPHSVAEYLDQPGVWVDQFAPALGQALGPLWPLILAAAVAGLVLGAKRGGLQRGLALMGVAAAVAYALIPVSASGSPGRPSGFESNLRYLSPALITGLMLLSLQREQVDRNRWMRYLLPALTLAFCIGLPGSSGWGLRQLLLGLVLASLLVVLPLAAARVRRTELPTLRQLLALGLALALILALGYPTQRDYLRSRYVPALAPPGDNPGFRETPQWRRIQGWALKVRDSRIAISGPPAAFGQYVFYGSDLSNQVRYLGEPAPHGGYRPIANCTAWRAAVNRYHPRFLVVTPASELGPGAVPQEILWTRGASAAHEVLDAHPAAVFRIDHPLEPAACHRESLPPVIRVPGGGFAVPGTGR
jgi:hypothetical protein